MTSWRMKISSTDWEWGILLPQHIDVWLQLWRSQLKDLNARFLRNSSIHPHSQIVPRVFVWGSCFWFCIPPPPRRLLLSSFTHTTLSHTIFHTQLCHTPSFTHNFVTHHLSHTTLSHIIFHTPIFHTQPLSHTTSSHIICHTPIFHTHLCHTHNFITHHLFTQHLSHTTGLGLVARLDRIGRRWRRGTLRGRCGAWRHPPSFCMAGVALGDIHLRFAWQAWRLETCTFVLRGRRGAGDTGLGLVARLEQIGRRWRRGTLRGRRGTWRHPRSFCVAGVSLTIFHTIYLSHTIFRTQLCHTPSFTWYLSHTLDVLAPAEIVCSSIVSPVQVAVA